MPQASLPPQPIRCIILTHSDRHVGFATDYLSVPAVDFSSDATFFQVPDRLGRLAQCLRPVDDRHDLASLDEFLQEH